MLKTVSSITNAIGALNFKGTWNASTNTPTIVSGVGVKGDYFVVAVAGSTTIDGISNWGVGDWITYNGTVWQRVEGGADLNGVNLSVSGTTTLSNLTASTALALNASKEIVSVTNTGTGDNVLATAPTLVGDVTLSTGNLVVADTKGIDFSATGQPAGMTSELLADYEEGTWTPKIADAASGGNESVTAATSATYTRIGRLVTIQVYFFGINTTGLTAGNTLHMTGLPYSAMSLAGSSKFTCSTLQRFITFTGQLVPTVLDNTAYVVFETSTSASDFGSVKVSDLSSLNASFHLVLTYNV
jgi:hypothetical protein